MKYSLMLAFAAYIFLPLHSSFASDITLPEKNLRVQNAYTSPTSLEEAKFLLEKISIELKRPAQEPNQPPPTKHMQEATYTPVKQEDLSISRPGDLEMSCGSLSQESLGMRNIIYATQDIKDSAKIKSHGITAAGAVGSFLIGSVTGGVGLALGGFLLDQNVGQISDDADHIQDVAEQRRTLMMGIYNAKGCEGPLDHAMQNPEIFNPLSKLAAIETAGGENQGAQYND